MMESGASFLKISIVVCNHGLGHLKRVLHVLEAMLGPRDLEFTIFVDERKLLAFPEMVDRFRDASVRFEHVGADLLNYEQKLSSQQAGLLREADAIWSDNQTFPLRYGKRVVLTGSFLWSEVLGSAESVFAKAEEQLLQEFSPLMLGLEAFASPNARRLTRFQGVGIYNYEGVKEPFLGKNVLIACGKSDLGRAHFRNEISTDFDAIVQSVKRLAEWVHKDGGRVLLEEEFYPLFSGIRGVHRADFLSNLFAQTRVALIRPGIGTVCDLLAAGARIYSLEENHFEMKHNSSVLRQLGVGEECYGWRDGLERMERYLMDSSLQGRHRRSHESLRFSGIQETATALTEFFRSA